MKRVRIFWLPAILSSVLAGAGQNQGVGHVERKPPDTPEHLKYEQETTLARTVFERETDLRPQ